jgi:hypothetical protein
MGGFEALLPWFNLLLIPIFSIMMTAQKRLTRLETLTELLIDGKLERAKK